MVRTDQARFENQILWKRGLAINRSMSAAAIWHTREWIVSAIQATTRIQPIRCGTRGLSLRGAGSED
jgi:hypothetical protein